jgi:hypothetical protein
LFLVKNTYPRYQALPFLAASSSCPNLHAILRRTQTISINVAPTMLPRATSPRLLPDTDLCAQKAAFVVAVLSTDIESPTESLCPGRLFRQKSMSTNPFIT